MKIPSGLLGLSGTSLKGFVFLSSSPNNEEELLEYGMERDGNNISCFVLTAPGDVIELGYALNAGSCDFVDVVVDGIRRFSLANDKQNIEFRGTVKRVLFSARGKPQRRGGLKNSLMQVKAREFDNDAEQEDDPVSSVVGSIIFEVFQKSNSDTEPEDDAEDDEAGECDRYPNFEKYATWDETPTHNGIQDGEPTTSMEIDLIDGTKCGKANKDRNLHSYSAQYKQVAKFIFKLRSTSDLETMGRFEDVPEYEAPEYVTLEQKRAMKTITPGEDTQAATGEDDEAEDEAEETPKAKSIPGSGKKVASKVAKGKAKKNSSPNKQDTKKTKIKEDDEAEDNNEDEEELTPKIPKKAASMTSKAKTPKKKSKASTPEKPIGRISATVTDMSIDDDQENEIDTIVNEEQTSIQQTISEGPPDKDVHCPENVKAYIVVEDGENADGDILEDSFVELTEPSMPTSVVPLTQYRETGRGLIDQDLGVTRSLQDLLVQDAMLGGRDSGGVVGLPENIQAAQKVKDQDIISTSLKKKLLTIQGSLEAPAYHAWVERDLQLALQRQLLGTKVEGPRSAIDKPDEELRETDPPSKLTTSEVLQTTAIQPHKSKSKMDQQSAFGDPEGAYDSDDGSLDLDAPQHTPSRAERRIVARRSPDLPRFENENEGPGKSTSKSVEETENSTKAGTNGSDNTSQLTDVAPLEEVLASVASSKCDQLIAASMSTDLGAAYDKEQVLQKSADISELDLAKDLDVVATGNRIPAHSAISEAPTKSNSTIQGILKPHAASTPTKGEPVSQSQISTQSYDSSHLITSSPAIENGKITALGESIRSGHMEAKEDIDDTILLKQTSDGLGDTKTTPATAKTAVKRTLSSMTDTSPESSDPKKSSATTKTAKPAEKRKRASISKTDPEVDTPKKPTPTSSKKSADKRKSDIKAESSQPVKSPAKTPSKAAAKKRKSASMSGSKDDTDSPRKSASTPAHRKSASVQLEMAAAKARVEAAEKKKLELEEEYRAALSVNEDREKAKKLAEKAEQMEQDNDELQARIAAIYSSPSE